ncbi:hypothetical protein GGQ13_003061 [Salinibacter ruber]|uniref:Uncharacterized protein n=1 Tax=Salinibacter ruber TaxID=146919 RepID=A0A9X2ZZS6_9BACT|nr:hypothetical protein [Salinibacter ruber]MCS4037707.1 hypothetical protein [Salinibacter ruber]MCS4139606.1 hypothetical protein [Salinibacter ruber]
MPETGSSGTCRCFNSCLRPPQFKRFERPLFSESSTFLLSEASGTVTETVVSLRLGHADAAEVDHE